MLTTRPPKSRGNYGADVWASTVAPLGIAHRQTQMFCRKADIEFPPTGDSADSMGEVEADDQHRYYIKGDAHGRLVRASEWICTHISEAVGIGAPTPSAIELRNGSIVFGSRRIALVADAPITVAYLTTPTISNLRPQAQGLRTILSSIYALDMFLNNDDRHFGNYLSVDDKGTRRLYAFDFSRALFWRWPWQGFPSVGDNTRKWGEILRAFHGFDQNAAFSTLDRLSDLAPNTIEGFINGMPSDWLPSATRAEFIDWWGSEAKYFRIQQLRAGIVDGSLL